MREGADVTIVSMGAILSESLKAAESLANFGVSARVISLNTLKPFDNSIIFDACRETGGIISIEEHVEIGGLAGSISEACLTANIIPGFFPDRWVDRLVGKMLGLIKKPENLPGARSAPGFFQRILQCFVGKLARAARRKSCRVVFLDFQNFSKVPKINPPLQTREFSRRAQRAGIFPTYFVML